MAAAKELADEHHIAVVVAHHDRKAKADDDWLDAVSGTHGLAGAADTIVVLSAPAGRRTASSESPAETWARPSTRWRSTRPWRSGTCWTGRRSTTWWATPARPSSAGSGRTGRMRPKHLADALDLDHELVKKTAAAHGR